VSDEKELAGLVALVTGGSRRMGLAIAQELGRAGADVVVNFANDPQQAERAVQSIEALGARAMAIQADVAQPDQVERMVAAAVDRFGGLDILINNAAKRPHTELDNITLDDWHSVIRLVLDGAFLCAKAAELYLPRTGRGSIINIGGLVALLGNAHTLHVSAAKSGLVGVTRSLAHHFGPLGVTVNCVTPGSVGAPGDDAARRARQHSLDQIPMRRLGTTEDVAGVVRSIAGPRFRFLTGQNIHLNGGIFMS
jgi:3-oxoacyl-[acyl-carrier protein] reductase